MLITLCIKSTKHILTACIFSRFFLKVYIKHFSIFHTWYLISTCILMTFYQGFRTIHLLWNKYFKTGVVSLWCFSKKLFVKCGQFSVKHPCRGLILIKLLFNFIKKAIQDLCCHLFFMHKLTTFFEEHLGYAAS